MTKSEIMDWMCENTLSIYCLEDKTCSGACLKYQKLSEMLDKLIDSAPAKKEENESDNGNTGTASSQTE